MAVIDVNQVKFAVANDPERLLDLLIEVGIKEPKFVSETQIQAGWETNSSGKAVLISISDATVTYHRFSTGDHGDIIQLVQLKTNKTFLQALEFVYRKFKAVNNKMVITNLKRITDLERILQIKEVPIAEYMILPEDILNPFITTKRFLVDNITLNTQEKYHIWLETFSDRICVNWRDFDGNLVGSVGRLNKDQLSKYENKYLPTIINFKKAYHLFGLYENKEFILNKKSLVIFEAEKSVLQCSSFGFHFCAALGSSNISLNQLDILNTFKIENLIFGFDEGLEHVEKNIRNIKKIIDNHNMNFNLYYIKHNENVTKKNSHDSPSDRGEYIFYKHLRKNLRKLKE